MFDSRPQWHLMAKPPEGRRNMLRLRGSDRLRGEELLHWTVLPLGPEYDMFVPAIREALRELDLPPFTIRWDRLVASGRHVTLMPSRIPPEAARLRRAIRMALARAGVTVSKEASRPHVTLNYGWDGEAFKQEIEPIVWRITDVLLIESVTGQTRHEPHGSFPLIPRQGLLFPWLAESRNAARTAPHRHEYAGRW